MRISEEANDATMDASHTHAMPERVVGGDFVMESIVSIKRDTYAVIDGLIHRYQGLFWREDGGHTVGCHTINCPTHNHWEPVSRHWAA